MNRWVFLIAVFSYACPAYATATKDEIAECAISLSPEITLINTMESTHNSWLMLVTEKTYEAAKKEIRTSGAFDYVKLIGASGDFNYSQFDEKRREYLNLSAGEYKRDAAVSIFQQSLPPKAGDTFVACIRAAATVADGLRVWFSDESAQHAFLHVRFRGIPSTSVKYKISLVGGYGGQPTGSLPHDGEIQYDITRSPNGKEIRVTVASTNPAGLADSAVSVRPGPGVERPKPKFIPAEIWSPETAVGTNSKPCDLSIKDRELIVMSYDVTSAGLALTMKGISVQPQPGTYPLAPSLDADTTILASRKLDDFSVGADSEIWVTGPQSAKAILIKMPHKIKDCNQYKLHFSNAKIVIKQPPAIFAAGNDVLTETNEYKGSGDYALLSGNVGCPGNCGNLFAADLTSKLSRPVWSLEAVRFVSQTGNPQWYRCYVTTPVCETTGEVTVTNNRKSGSCLGKATCYSWRFSTSGTEATDTFELKYKEKVCVRYCTR